MDAESSKIPLDEVAEWKRHGSELRKRLLEQRAVHVDALAKIDRALAELPSERSDLTNGSAHIAVVSATAESEKDAGPAPSLWTLKRSRLQEIVDTVISHHPKGMTAKEVVQAVQAIKKSADQHNIYTALYRSKKIRGEGDSRSKTYYPLETKPV